MRATTPLEAVLRRDRLVVIAGLACLTALAWAYMFYLAWDMRQSMSIDTMQIGMTLASPQIHSWAATDFVLMFTMWVVMMAGMMVPTAAPMILSFALVNRRRLDQQQPFVPTSVFLLGYLIIWSGFAAAATLAQWGLHAEALLSPMMVSTNSLLGGVLLLSAGVFQWSPLKYACLNRCRTPLGFIMTEWREGPKGAIVMGLRHGTFCLGCCWILMTLLFVLGVMNLLWIAVLASFVLIEKVAPAGHWISRIGGISLVGWGMWMIVSSIG